MARLARVIVMRRWRRLGIYVLGWVLALVLLAVLEAVVPEADAAPLPDFGQTVLAVAGYPPSGAIAAAVAALVILSPDLNPAWHRFGWGGCRLGLVNRSEHRGQTQGANLDHSVSPPPPLGGVAPRALRPPRSTRPGQRAFH